MANSLLKQYAHNSFADGVYRQLLLRSTRYYYFIGKTLSWINDSNPPQIIDSVSYEKDVRDDIIALKEISPSDVAYVLPRVDWVSGTTYDYYDDRYSSEIQGLNLTSGGSVYTSTPTITIGTLVPVSTTVTVGSQYYYSGFLYTVKTSGTTTSVNTGLTGIIGTDYSHGSAILTCVGVQATATATLGTSGINNQKVISITMTNRGSGYVVIPVVTFSSGTATATAVMATGVSGAQLLQNANYYVLSGNNIYVCVENNNGTASTVAPTGTSYDFLSTADGYVWKYISTVPTNSKFLTTYHMPVFTVNQYQYTANGSIVTAYVDNEGSGYVSASVILPTSTTITVGSVYLYDGYVYTVSVTGITPSTISGLGTTINSSYTIGTATVVCNGANTTITVTGDGSNAVLTPLITNGKIVQVQITNGGSGYSYANTIISGIGSGAVISTSILNGTTSSTSQAQSELLTTDGSICSIKKISGGYNYTSPVVTITGDGTGATATATVVNSQISKITLTNRGSGYRWATITITDSAVSGAGASARAIVSPYGGLGKDPINNLSVKSLMFYSNISNNTNHGITVSNDYRQIGIIKDPVKYSDGTTLTSNFATTCWKITATTTIPASIVEDDELTVTANSISYRFRVVSKSGSDILLLSIDNLVPVSGMQFSKTVSISFLASSIISPTVLKYSGDMLFIDNESPFVATTGTPAILRTVINF